MIIVLILISIIAIIILKITDWEEMAIIPLIILGVEILVAILVLIALVDNKVVDEKINLYQIQNKEIENKIELVVKEYMRHENNTFKELKTNESYITLVTLYPELKSDKLIEKEIELYEENNEIIIVLKEQKINEKVYKWWLYFG